MSYQNFITACQEGNLQSVDDYLNDATLLAQAADNNNQALRMAACYGRLTVVNRLLDIPEVAAAATEYDNWALKFASINGHLAGGETPASRA